MMPKDATLLLLNRRALFLLLKVSAAWMIWNQYKSIPSQTKVVVLKKLKKPTNAKTVNQKPLIPLDLVVMLSGELGNYLLKIAYGKIVQTVAEEDGRFNFTLRFVSPGSPKSYKTSQEIKQCFPKHFSEKEINMDEFLLKSPEWKEITRTQSKVVGSHYMDWEDNTLASKMLHINGSTTEEIRSSLDHLHNVLHRMGTKRRRNRYNLSIPLVLVHKMPTFPLIDKYWDTLAEIFTFKDAECCLDLPQKDESVLHIRGFNVERPQDYEVKGMKELPPTRTSENLLHHLNVGDKVAIISRYPDQLADFTESLQNRGLHVRTIANQTGVQDFCFLKSATKEVIGGRKSTFFLAAAFLNPLVAKVTVYCYQQPSILDCDTASLSKFTNSKLARKEWNFPIFY
jgi:hypothetical protein